MELMGEKEVDIEKGLEAMEPGETGDMELVMALGNMEA